MPVWTKSDVETLQLHTSTRAQEALQLAICVARILSYAPAERDKCYALYKRTTLRYSIAELLEHSSYMATEDFKSYVLSYGLQRDIRILHNALGRVLDSEVKETSNE